MIKDVLFENLKIRSYYLNQIKWWSGKPIVKVIIWARRVGKSSLLKQLIQDFVKKWEYIEDQIFYINKELPDYDNIKTYEDLTKLILDFIKGKEKIIIAIDEIQEIEHWEKTINWILSKYQNKVDIYITWSNAHLLSWEYATYLTGRYIAIQVYPMTFDEYCLFNNLNKSNKTFIEFIERWGLPWASIIWDSKDFIYQYLNSVYSTIIQKDIEPRFKINKKDFFQNLYKYVFTNVWNIFSAKSITDYLKNERINISVDTVLDYLSYWEDAYLLNKVHSQDMDSKKTFSIYNKYYAWDLWIRNSISWYDYQRDIWLLLENCVFLVLKKYWFNINIWRHKNWKEVDFVAEKYGKIRYVQVAQTLINEQTMKREYDSLSTIKDNRPKLIVSLDEFNLWESNWINHVNVFDFEESVKKFF